MAGSNLSASSMFTSIKVGGPSSAMSKAEPYCLHGTGFRTPTQTQLGGRRLARLMKTQLGIAPAFDRPSTWRGIRGCGREQAARRGFLNDHRRIFRQQQPPRHEVLHGARDFMRAVGAVERA